MRDLRDRPRDHSFGVAGKHSGRPALQQELYARHEYMGTVAALGPDVDEFEIGERIIVEIHAACGQCKRCRQGMYTSCLNYGKPRRATAPTASPPMAASQNTPSTTSTRWRASPTP